MSSFVLNCLKICRISRLNTLFSAKYQNIFCKNISRKLLIGIVPVIPTVSAHTASIEDKNKPKYIEENLQSVFSKVNDDDSEREEKSGWERLCAVYSLDEYGNLSVEMTATIQAASFSCFIGLVYGGVKYSRAAFTDFMDRNQASIFENHLDAKKKLQNHVTVHFAKGAFKWSWRLTLFTSSFMLLILSLSAYRGEATVTNYMMSGTVVGALLRWKLGPRGMIAGALVGLMLGTFCGLSTTTLLSLTGHSLDDVIAFQNELEKSKMGLFMETKKIAMEEDHLDPESLALLKRHETSSENTPPV